MRFFIYILLWVIPYQCLSQSFINKSQLNEAQKSTEPIVVEFWADWNDSNKCQFLGSLKDCRKYRICIEDFPDLAESYKIRVLPTIIIFNKTEEIKRYKGNLLFKLDIQKQDIQAIIDSIVISKYR
tara:strand:+ start:474 stop:851 length:378 start_codon:yes stop_codon:yes gene_type:complete